MTFDVEGVVDCRMGGNKALGLALGLESLHLPFPSADRQMRIFDAIIVSQPARSVAILTTQNLHCGLIRSQAIGHDCVRHEALVFEQFPEQFQRSRLVAALLDQDVENFTFLVDGAPHEHANSVDPHDHFVEMPNAGGTSALAANVGGDHRAELVGPAANGLVGDVDSAFGEHLLNIAQARGKTEIEPNCQADRVRWKAVTLEGNGFHSRSSIRLIGR